MNNKNCNCNRNFNCNSKTECPLFRKVVIPAIMGDDSKGSPNAPKNGAYCNAIVEYEANKSLYIYSSDGMYTLIALSSEIYDTVKKMLEEADAKQKEYIDLNDSEIREQIAARTEILGKEIEDLGRDIANEASYRAAADNSLYSAINSESNTREAADAALSERIDAISEFKYRVVDELPEEGESGVIYLVPQDREAPNIYDEFMWIDGKFEKIGDTKPDLTDYVKNTDYAVNNGRAGVVKVGDTYGIKTTADGVLYAINKDLAGYDSAVSNLTISKGTLENILNGRKYLMPEYIQELPTTGAENKLYLVPAEEQPDMLSHASGKDIEIADASEGDLIDWTINGDTEQASYSGKNLYKYIETGTKNGITISRNEDGYSVTGTATARADFYAWEEDIAKFENGATYTLSANISLQNVRVLLEAYNGSTWIKHALGSSAYLDSTKQVITHAIDLTGADRIRFTIRVDTGLASNINGLKIQLEKGYPTNFEPYVGGAASPSPEFPQEVKTVTGRNIIKVNEQEVEVDLGDIELCKLGDYQDRIYKDGDEWKLEKNIMKRVFDGNDSDLHPNGWFSSSETTSTLQVCALDIHSLHIKYSDRDYSKMTHFVYRDGTFSNGQYKLVNNASGEVNHIRISISKDITPDLNSGKEWIAENRPEIYAILLNPTVETITNQHLIDQLNALETLATVKGYNLITTDTATIQPFLEFDYYRPDPTVTKEEWLWIENHYEQIGGQRKYSHNLSVNHSTAQGHWDYTFQITDNESQHYTQLAQIAKYMFNNHAGMSVPVSGTYTEGNDVYILTKISAYAETQVMIEMRKLSDGSIRRISTGAVPVSDNIS